MDSVWLQLQLEKVKRITYIFYLLLYFWTIIIFVDLCLLFYLLYLYYIFEDWPLTYWSPAENSQWRVWSIVHPPPPPHKINDYQLNGMSMTNLGISARLLVSLPSPLKSLASPPNDETNKTQSRWFYSVNFFKCQSKHSHHLSSLQQYEYAQRKSHPREPKNTNTKHH